MRSTVLQSTSLLQLFSWILDKQTLSTIIVVCSTKKSFVHNLNAAISQALENSGSTNNKVAHDLLHPPLKLLAKSQSITLTYCPSIFSLYAFLSVCQKIPQLSSEDLKLGSSRNPSHSPMLILWNPISLFSDAPSHFSAQGIGRLFASAYEAAVRSERGLVVVECPRLGRSMGDAELERDESAVMTGPDDTNMTESIGEDEVLARENDSNDNLIDPWAQKIPLQSSSDRKYGSVEKRWFERSISVRAVAERWCEFFEMSA